MDDLHENIEEYNSNKKRKILTVFDAMIADMLSDKNFNLIVTELSIRGRKPNISLVFITQSYFKVPRDVRLNTTHFLSWKLQTNKNFNKLHLIIHWMLNLKTS